MRFYRIPGRRKRSPTKTKVLVFRLETASSGWAVTDFANSSTVSTWESVMSEYSKLLINRMNVEWFNQWTGVVAAMQVL
jgi:hypothetical protein